MSHDEHVPAPEPSGISTGTVLLGVIVSALAAAGLVWQISEGHVDGPELGPAVLAASGGVLVLLALVGLLARRRRG